MFQIPDSPWNQLSSYWTYPTKVPQGPSWRLLDFLNWIENNMSSVSMEWIPFYQLMSGYYRALQNPMMRPTNLREFPIQTSPYKSFSGNQKFLESLMKAYGMGKGLAYNPPPLPGNSNY